MRLAWLMVVKDLRRTRRRPLGMLIMLMFPVLFAGMLALTFGAGNEPRMPRVKLLVEDRDQSLLSAALVNAVRSEQMAEFFEVEEATAEVDPRARMERGEASALLVIPEKFGDDLLYGRPATLELVKNPAEQILPEVAEQLARSLTEVLDAGSRALRGPMEDIAELIEDGADAPADAAISTVAVAINRIMTGSAKYVMPPAITLKAVTLDEPDDQPSQRGVPSVFLIVLPGIAVFALFMIGDQAMRDLLEEAQTGTLRRQLSGPLDARRVVLGKALFTAVMSLLSLAVLTAVGAVVSPRPVDLPGFVSLGLALVLLVTGTAALVYGLARTERQGATIASMVYLFLGFVGGGFIQTRILPPVLRSIAPYTPFYWATEGFRKVVNLGAGLAEVLPYVGLLLALGALGLVLGGRMLERKVLAGWSG